MDAPAFDSGPRLQAPKPLISKELAVFYRPDAAVNVENRRKLHPWHLRLGTSTRRLFHHHLRHPLLEQGVNDPPGRPDGANIHPVAPRRRQLLLGAVHAAEDEVAAAVDVGRDVPEAPALFDPMRRDPRPARAVPQLNRRRVQEANGDEPAVRHAPTVAQGADIRRGTRTVSPARTRSG